MVPLAWHDAQIKRLWSLYDALLARLPAQGPVNGQPFVTGMTVVPNGVSRETPGPDPLLELIDAKCGSDYRKRAMMLRQLAADRAAGVSQEDILAAIEYGVGSHGVPG
jgi:hypothetical protein